VKSVEKPQTYEAVPAKMVIPGVPLPAEAVRPAKLGSTPANLNALPIQGVSTLAGSLDQADGKGDELLKECRRCIRKRDFPEFLYLLGMYPGLIADRWIRETLFRLAKQGRLRRYRGRPTGSYKIYPLLVVGLVEQLLSGGEAPNREHAFVRLEELGIMSYESAKDLFYRALQEERFRAILLTSPELTRVATAEEVAEEVRNAETLHPGGRITRTVEHPHLGSVNITFEAK